MPSQSDLLQNMSHRDSCSSGIEMTHKTKDGFVLFGLNQVKLVEKSRIDLIKFISIFVCEKQQVLDFTWEHFDIAE